MVPTHLIIIIIIIIIVIFRILFCFDSYIMVPTHLLLLLLLFFNLQNLMQRVQHQAYQVERERERSFIVCADLQRDISPPDPAGQFVKDVFFFFFSFFKIIFWVPRLWCY
jgi:hypothetical protein